MFKTEYKGKVELLGSGRFQSNWFVRRSIIKLSDHQKLKNILASDELDDFMESGIENEDEIKLAVGWVMFYRWVLSVSHSGETMRQGVLLLTIGMISHLAIVFLVALIAGALLGGMIAPALGVLVGLVLAGYAVVTGALNIRAWLAPGLRVCEAGATC